MAALAAAMVIAAPIMAFGFRIAPVISAPLEKLMTSMNVWKPIAELIYVVLPNVLAFTISMAGFMLGVTWASEQEKCLARKLGKQEPII